MAGPFFIIIACFLWAIDMVVRNTLIASIPAHMIVFFEQLFLALILFWPLWKSRQKFWSGQVSHMFYFIMVGAVGSALATMSFTSAFTFINPSVVVILQKLQPIVAILFARILLHERIGKHYILWSGVCLLGAILVASEHFSALWNGAVQWDSSGAKGYTLALLAVLGWGSATVFGKKLMLNGYDEKEIMSGRFFFGLLGMIIFIIASGSEFSPPESGLFYGKIAVMVILSGLLGMYFYYRGLFRISARLCALMELTFPFCAVVVSWLFLGKPLTSIQIMGGALILLGGTVIQMKHY